MKLSDDLVKISVFLPLRKGSERVKSKNTKEFSKNGDSLFVKKINQLLEITDFVHEIIISTDDEVVIDYCKNFGNHDTVKCLKRPPELCRSNTSVKDLIAYVKNVVSGDLVLWVHATSPFVEAEDYLKGLELYFRLTKIGRCDSIMSVNRIQQFIWSDKNKRIINNHLGSGEWPNTQDLEPLYMINHAFYINPVANYINYENRIGINPSLYICEGIKTIDIDDQIDFNIAQAIESILPSNKNIDLI